MQKQIQKKQIPSPTKIVAEPLSSFRRVSIPKLPKKPRVKKYSAQWFINFFNKIPKKLWVKGSLHEDQRSCALGHLGSPSDDVVDLNEEGEALTELLSGREDLFGDDFLDVPGINDSAAGEYNIEAEHPKDRIIAALKMVRDNPRKKGPACEIPK